MSKNISIFGSYRCDCENEEYKAAYEIAYRLAKLGYTIINGGGGGIMQASTQGVEEAGGKSIGIIIKKYMKESKVSIGNKIIVCDSLFERLDKLINNSVGFIIFSGGTGTLVELSLSWELINKGLLKKLPIVCFGDYWKTIVERFKNEPSFVNKQCAELIKFEHTVSAVVKRFTI